MRKPKLKTIDIQAKEWFDKINGNSYFAGKVTVNYGMKSEKVFTMPYEYGYGSQYEQTAFQLLIKEGYLPENREFDFFRTNKIIVRSNIQRNCLKKELKEYV